MRCPAPPQFGGGRQVVEGRERQQVQVRVARHDPVCDGHRVVDTELLGELAPGDRRRNQRQTHEVDDLGGQQACAMTGDPMAGRRPCGSGRRHVQVHGLERAERQRKGVQLGGGQVAERVALGHPWQVRAAAVDEQGQVEAYRSRSVEYPLQVARPQPVARHAAGDGVAHGERLPAEGFGKVGALRHPAILTF
ncbi:hypothetical protein [Conyzicola sp.]|uniref:hypothetical protein n=1 Tax=Conyzicola sp. TaxID=1969404 RepID=UPI003988B018